MRNIVLAGAFALAASVASVPAAFAAMPTTTVFDLLSLPGTTTSGLDEGVYWANFETTVTLPVGIYNIAVSWVAPSDAADTGAHWMLSNNQNYSLIGDAGAPSNSYLGLNLGGKYTFDLYREALGPDLGSFTKAQLTTSATTAVPGPTAGSGMLALLGLAGLAFYRRRNSAQSLG
jgi:MYXO-CTERM domain-containing protein